MLIAEGINDCLAVVAALCINGTAKADISPGPGWAGAVITLESATIISTIDSDAIVYSYKPNMKKLCANNHCIFYKGFCRKSKRGLGCSIWYSFGDVEPLRKIEINGNRTSVLAAVKSIKIVKSPDVTFPLSSFRYDATDDSPPACYARRGCPASQQ